MKTKKVMTVGEVYKFLKDLSRENEDIYFLSFRLDGVNEVYQVKNKANGVILSTDYLNSLKNISFVNTAKNEPDDLLSYMKRKNFNPENGDGEVIMAYDGNSEINLCVVIHHTKLGPSLGGLREKDYLTCDEMLTDNLRLSPGMSNKSAVANIRAGGGKATRTVPKKERLEANLGTGRLLLAVNTLRFQRGLSPYNTGEDSGISCPDLDQMSGVNPNTLCKSPELGGTGNPSPVTAVGVFYATLAGALYAFPDKTIEGKTVLISGLGEVGFELLKNFLDADVQRVFCVEPNQERVSWVKEQITWAKQGHKVSFFNFSKDTLNSRLYIAQLAHKVDIFAPCALGRSINDENIVALKGKRLKLICGAENNQLVDDKKHGQLLFDYGVVYVPDFVANAGGLINCFHELAGEIALISKSVAKAQAIGETVRKVLEMSYRENIPPILAAIKMAEAKYV